MDKEEYQEILEEILEEIEEYEDIAAIIQQPVIVQQLLRFFIVFRVLK